MAESLFDEPLVLTTPTKKPVPPLVRLEAHDHFTGVILSTRVHWVGCHWDGRRSLPHLKDKLKCQGCHDELPKHFKGFLFVIFDHDRKACFLELSELAAQNFRFLNSETNNARGCLFHASRERRTKKSPVKITHKGDHRQLSLLPPDQSPIRTMCRIWRCEHLLDAWLAEQQNELSTKS